MISVHIERPAGTVHAKEQARGPMSVTFRCGCGWTVTATGSPCESQHDIADTADGFLDGHLLSDEIEGVCRPWLSYGSDRNRLQLTETPTFILAPTDDSETRTLTAGTYVLGEFINTTRRVD